MFAALKVRRPYAVAIDLKMRNGGGWPGSAGESRKPRKSNGSDTPIQLNGRSSIPAGIPHVTFWDDGNARLAFSLLNQEGSMSDRVNSRLGDAIRQSDKTTAQELKTVLIIDDEPAILELLTKTLLQNGFGVFRTSDGRTGVELATNRLPDLIILDFSMPELNGGQIVEQLRTHPRTKQIPILINTGTMLSEEERQRLAGQVQSITFKSERKILPTEPELLGALSDEAVGTGANS